MTEPVGVEHGGLIGLFIAAIGFATALVTAKAGGSEGKRAIVEQDQPAAMRQLLGASLLDVQTANRVLQELAAIKEHLGTLVELTEGKEERELRDHIRDDMRLEMDKLFGELRRSSGDKRAALHVGSPPPEQG